MKFAVMTLFPEQIDGALCHGVIGKAAEKGIINIERVNIRDFAVNKHGQVDDYPYGGGAGMVMMPRPVYDAYLKAREIVGNCRVLYMSPQGKPFNQRLAEELSFEPALILLCGHYEGIDERVINEINAEEISLGDFILTGGEIAAAAVIDAVTRLLPGVLGNDESCRDESFSDADGLLEYPQYTRPPVFMGREVPAVLLSGHHGEVDKWRREKAIEKTRVKRPDLLK